MKKSKLPYYSSSKLREAALKMHKDGTQHILRMHRPLLAAWKSIPTLTDAENYAAQEHALHNSYYGETFAQWMRFMAENTSPHLYAEHENASDDAIPLYGSAAAGLYNNFCLQVNKICLDPEAVIGLSLNTVNPLAQSVLLFVENAQYEPKIDIDGKGTMRRSERNHIVNFVLHSFEATSDNSTDEKIAFLAQKMVFNLLDGASTYYEFFGAIDKRHNKLFGHPLSAKAFIDIAPEAQKIISRLASTHRGDSLSRSSVLFFEPEAIGLEYVGGHLTLSDNSKGFNPDDYLPLSLRENETARESVDRELERNSPYYVGCPARFAKAAMGDQEKPISLIEYLGSICINSYALYAKKREELKPNPSHQNQERAGCPFHRDKT